MRTVQIVRHHHRVHCSSCERPLFTVSDTRFGLPPPAVLCRECTLVAFQRSD